jgi:hypothetical protein
MVVMLAAVIVLVAVGGYLYYTQRAPATNSQPQATDTTPSSYQSNKDLEQAAASMDSTDINAGLDSSLEQLDTEVSNF